MARCSDVGRAQAAHDVVDHVDVALAAVDVYLTSLSPPISSCVHCHNLVKCQSRAVPNGAGRKTRAPKTRRRLRAGKRKSCGRTIRARPTKVLITVSPPA